MRILVAGGLMVLSMLAPQDDLLAQQQTKPLDAPYTTKIGDVAAAALSELLKVRTDVRYPTVVSYEPSTGTIDVEVFATPSAGSKTDEARAVLGVYWQFIEAAHIPYVERRFKVKLSAENYRLLYYDRTQEKPLLVLQFVKGQYLIP
jgi:hypothetical protein